MKTTGRRLTKFAGLQVAAMVLASASAIPGVAQQSAPSEAPASTAASAAQPRTAVAAGPAPAKEGFWGRVNPWARKKWVKKQTGPINDRLTELDDVNAKNAKDIQDVDGRSQAGIRQAQSAADAANRTATAAGDQARQASAAAQGAAGQVDQLTGTVNGLDQYRTVTEAEVTFRGGQPTLSADARKQLDALAATINGRQGYLLEVEARSPLAGSAGIQSTVRMAESVKRYLVTEHDIPVYRMHAVALGNAPNAEAASQEAGATPQRVRAGTVRVRLMENTLAAQGAAPSHGDASSTGAERP